MKRFLVIVLLTLFSFSSNVFAGNENFSAGARQAGMADAGVTLTDLWSSQHNQAGLARLEKISVGVYYESKFFLPDLGFRCGAFALPVKKLGVFGLYFSDYGSSNYKEQKAGVSFAKTFGNLVSFGMQIDYLNTSIGEDYGSQSAVAAEAGVIVSLTNKLDLGAHIYNPTRAKLSEYNDERSPTIMRMGLGYKFSTKIKVAAEAEKDVNAKNIFKMGLEYDIVKMFSLRLGISSDPSLVNFGFGINVKGLRIDAAASMHQELGYTPKVSLQYEF